MTQNKPHPDRAGPSVIAGVIFGLAGGTATAAIAPEYTGYSTVILPGVLLGALHYPDRFNRALAAAALSLTVAYNALGTHSITTTSAPAEPKTHRQPAPH